MAVEIFFRNLFMPVHKTRWDQRRYTSSQEPHGIPIAWAEAAVANQPEAVYPLATVGVLFLQTAREKFFAFVQALKANPDPVFTAAGIHAAFALQPLHFREELLELAGVCAYTNAAELCARLEVQPVSKVGRTFADSKYHDHALYDCVKNHATPGLGRGIS